MSDTHSQAQTSMQGETGEKPMNESSNENDSEITDLDAQRPRRFASTPALRRGARYMWRAALLSSLLLLVLLINPQKFLLLLLSNRNHQPSHGTVLWVSNHDVFLVANQTVIYVASRDNMVAALRTRDGRLLWQVPTDGPVSGKPVIVGGVVYASSETTIYAISADTGRLLWHQTSDKSLLGGQPIVGEGIVSIALASGSLAAWRMSDGRPLWEASLKDEALVPVASAGGMIFADTSRGSIVAVRAMTGQFLWKHDAMQFAPPLLPAGNSVEISVDVPFTTPASLQQTENGTLLWRHDFSAAAMAQGGTIAIAEGNSLVFVSQQQSRNPGGSLTVLRAGTGQLLWQCATGTGFIPPLVTQGVVYSGSEFGSLDARRVEDGVLLWRYMPDNFPIVEVTVAQHTVYLGSQMGTVEAIAADTGIIRWRYDAGGPISDVTQGPQGVVLIGAGNGIITGLRGDTGTLLWHSSPLT
jgi:outer membrane protein assembly factor BamB